MTPAPQPAAEQPLRRRWGRVRFGYRANALMLFVGRHALWLAYVFVWFAAGYFFLTSGKARRASGDYLARVFGRRNRLRRAWDTYRHMVVYGYLLLDRSVMLSAEGHGFVVQREGIEGMYAAAAQEGGLILLSAHFGNAEAALPFMERKMGSLLRERPIHMVMYQDLQDATERFHVHTRRLLAGMEIISTRDPLRAGVQIIAALRGGAAVAIRADRSLEGKTLPVDFLGSPVRLPAGPFLAAALTGAPVVTVYTCRRGYRRYAVVLTFCGSYGEATAGSRDERSARAAGDYARSLETVVRRFPLQWGNFYDFWAATPPPDSGSPASSGSA